MELFLTYRTRRPPPADQGFCIFINSVLSGNILIDTTQVATDTIDLRLDRHLGQHRHQHPHRDCAGRNLLLISSVTSAENIPRASDHFFIPTNVTLAMSL
jgi:hypothetical protein